MIDKYLSANFGDSLLGNFKKMCFTDADNYGCPRPDISSYRSGRPERYL